VLVEAFEKVLRHMKSLPYRCYGVMVNF